LAFVLAFLASSLLLVSGLLSEKWTTFIFLAGFTTVLVAVMWLVRQQASDRWRFRERRLFQSRWGTLAVAALGFGLGILLHNRRLWFHWLWAQFRRLDTSEEWVLVSLFLLGVMLGFFVVRNWSKNQQEFIGSLTAALGAAFLATIVGTLAGNQQASTQQTPQQTLTTELSTAAATPAPVAANTPTAAPAPNRTAPAAAGAATTTATATGGAAAATPTPATVRATASTAPASTAPANPLVPVRTFAFYALGFALSGVLNLIAFSLLVASYSRTQSRTSRSIIEFLYGSDKAQVIDGYFLKSFEADPNYAKAKLVDALSAYRDIIRRKFAAAMNRRKNCVDDMTAPASSPDSPPVSAGEAAAPFVYYQLLAIRSIPQGGQQTSPPDNPKNSYEIIYRRLKGDEEGEPAEPITPEMFRVAISMKWLDNIEYVVTAGQYLKAFPYYGSVAGMALQVRKTIVMNRDRYKNFRTSDFVQGKTPSQADQPRGLYEIDYLSYITVPMLSSFGTPDEQALGLLHVDTKLFACPKNALPKDARPLAGTDAKSETYRIVIERDNQKELEEELNRRMDEFEGYACNLYRQDDPIIEELVKMKDVIIPLLELYKKCRTGSINQTAATTAAAAATTRTAANA
jgi:hypothetical protein